MDKKIIAALEIADHEVRLIVGQFYNGRLNVLKVERVSHSGIHNLRIMHSQSIVDAIKKSIQNASRMVGASITSVLMCVPGHSLKLMTRKLRVETQGLITKEALQEAQKQLRNLEWPDHSVLVNVVMNRFIINGMATRRIPLNEKAHSFEVEADCYYADQSVIFDFVSCVEKSGLSIIDIIPDDIGFAKEASLFESSINQPIVAITFNRNSTKLSLIYKGQVLSNETKNYGFGHIMNKLKETYKLSEDVVERLLYYNVDVNTVSPSQDPIFIWSTKSTTHTISQKDLLDVVGADIIRMLDEIYDSCEPIYNLGNPKYVLSGEASFVPGLPEILETISESEVIVYQPSTFGVKEPLFASLLGTFYYYKDNALYHQRILGSINEDDFMNDVIQIQSSLSRTKEETSITKRIKNLFTE